MDTCLEVYLILYSYHISDCWKQILFFMFGYICHFCNTTFNLNCCKSVRFMLIRVTVNFARWNTVDPFFTHALHSWKTICIWHISTLKSEFFHKKHRVRSFHSLDLAFMKLLAPKWNFAQLLYYLFYYYVINHAGNIDVFSCAVTNRQKIQKRGLNKLLSIHQSGTKSSSKWKMVVVSLKWGGRLEGWLRWCCSASLSTSRDDCIEQRCFALWSLL